MPHKDRKEDLCSATSFLPSDLPELLASWRTIMLKVAHLLFLSLDRLFTILARGPFC